MNGIVERQTKTPAELIYSMRVLVACDLYAADTPIGNGIAICHFTVLLHESPMFGYVKRSRTPAAAGW